MLTDERTIAAIATARGRAGVAVVRVSGREAWDIGWEVFSRKSVSFEHGRFYHGWLVDEGQLLDEVLLLAFRGPKSYTGEDVIEIHCHGGELTSQKVLALCLKNGARPARPGEFTLRAFLNGKLDLTQAESVMDLVSARSERLMGQATANLRNRTLGRYIDEMSRDLLELQARIVASIDFPDEVDEPDRGLLGEMLIAALEKVIRLREGAQRSRLIRDGIKVALLGMPNSGKSSLFNMLLASDRSIVTEQAGTTRDMVTESLEIEGVAITLIDTAGIRETRHSIEMMGIERSWQAASEAQIVLYLIDTSVGLLRYDHQVLSRLNLENTIIVGNKVDIRRPDSKMYADWVYVSARTGEDIQALLELLGRKVRHITHEESGMGLSLNQRQVACCQAVEECLRQAAVALDNPSTPLDIVTVPLTDALRKLDELLGRDTGEEVLTRVFQQFCVGK
jgi:tRNA modification GTPase